MPELRITDKDGKKVLQEKIEMPDARDFEFEWTDVPPDELHAYSHLLEAASALEDAVSRFLIYGDRNALTKALNSYRRVPK